jgi:hypothetical protein
MITNLMPKNQSISQGRKTTHQPHPRFIGSLVIGAVVAVFVGLLAMAVAILIVGILRLFLPDLTFHFAGMSITAVTFVIFCALGWIGATIIIWRKLSPE